MAKRILLADDLSEEKGARARARAVKAQALMLADYLGTDIDLIHAEDFAALPLHDPFVGSYVRNFIRSREQAVKREAKGGRVRPVLVNGPARAALISRARSTRYELIVVGTHGRRGIARLILGSTAEEIIRNARIPVCTVGPVAQKRAPRTSRSRPVIVVGADLSPASARAEVYALSLAKRIGAKVILVHCLYESLHPVLQSALASHRGEEKLADLYQELRGDAERKLIARQRRFNARGIECDYRCDLKSIAASRALLGAAEAEQADYILLGTHGRNLVSGAFFGSTVRGVILESSVPVITVRSRG